MDLYIILFIHFTALLELYSNISTLSQSEHHFPRVTDLNMSGPGEGGLLNNLRVC